MVLDPTRKMEIEVSNRAASKNARESKTAHRARAYTFSFCILDDNKDTYTRVLAFLNDSKNANLYV
jgi:hypothetical protein